MVSPEAHSPSGEMFSDQGLYDLLEKHAESVTETINQVEKTVRRHISTAPQFDDITMLLSAAWMFKTILSF